MLTRATTVRFLPSSSSPNLPHTFLSVALKHNRDRRDIFDEFCKEKIREQRAAKKKAAESGKKIDVRFSLPSFSHSSSHSFLLQPLTAFRALLASSVTSTRTHFSDFKRSHQKDVRYREFGKTEGDREKEFKKFLRELGEQKKAAAEKADREFKEMLAEDHGIMPGDTWVEVRCVSFFPFRPRFITDSSSTLHRSRSGTSTTLATPPSFPLRSASSSSQNTSPSSLPAHVLPPLLLPPPPPPPPSRQLRRRTRPPVPLRA